MIEVGPRVFISDGLASIPTGHRLRTRERDQNQYVCYSLSMPTNVLGTELRCCCRDPMTGFYRDGYCRTGPEDTGLHTVCVNVTREFLDDSVFQGNDLVTPHPEWGFPGLEPGDKWCLCASRYQEALRRGVAPPVDLEATHSSAIEFVTMEELKAHAIKE
jgi:uncharacterized protein (DUF2237 family)